MGLLEELSKTEKFKQYKKECCSKLPFNTSLHDSEGNLFGQYGTTHSTTLFTNTALFRCLLDRFFEHSISKLDNKFIDLGCGTGNMLIYAVSQGWYAIGLDISRGCIETAKMNINSAFENSYLNKNQHNKIKLIHTNFFPQGFDVERKKGDVIEDNFGEYLSELALSCPVKIDKDVFSKAKLFYHYQVERRQNILDLFSAFAPEEAYLAFVKSKDDNFIIPEDVKLISSKDDFFLYRKVDD